MHAIQTNKHISLILFKCQSIPMANMLDMIVKLYIFTNQNSLIKKEKTRLSLLCTKTKQKDRIEEKKIWTAQCTSHSYIQRHIENINWQHQKRKWSTKKKIGKK